MRFTHRLEWRGRGDLMSGEQTLTHEGVHKDGNGGVEVM